MLQSRRDQQSASRNAATEAATLALALAKAAQERANVAKDQAEELSLQGRSSDAAAAESAFSAFTHEAETALAAASAASADAVRCAEAAEAAEKELVAAKGSVAVVGAAISDVVSAAKLKALVAREQAMTAFNDAQALRLQVCSLTCTLPTDSSPQQLLQCLL